ncbi:MAG: hypothetical protein WBM11_14840 [Terriglobales bacterium]
MRFLKMVALVALCVLTLAGLSSAGQNKFGVADSRHLTLTSPTRVGDTLLPAGEYQVLHSMEGTNHIMLFKQLNVSKPVQTRVKCNLVPLDKRAERTETNYMLNAANERVLRSLVFEGDSAEHVF